MDTGRVRRQQAKCAAVCQRRVCDLQTRRAFKCGKTMRDGCVSLEALASGGGHRWSALPHFGGARRKHKMRAAQNDAHFAKKTQSV